MRLTILLVWMLAFVAGIHAQDNDVILGYCDEPEAGYERGGCLRHSLDNVRCR